MIDNTTTAHIRWDHAGTAHSGAWDINDGSTWGRLICLEYIGETCYRWQYVGYVFKKTGYSQLQCIYNAKTFSELKDELKLRSEQANSSAEP